MNIFNRVQKINTIGELLLQKVLKPVRYTGGRLSLYYEPLHLKWDRDLLSQMLVEMGEEMINEKLAASIGRKIIIQAIKDLTSDDKDIKISALKFFAEKYHKRFCEQAGIPAEEIHASVLTAVEQTGVRRMKLVGDILKELDK
tara:strand:- start:1460 stop:1888 length:429 start_codon:yes stop_codon:yes gene_type:complete